MNFRERKKKKKYLTCENRFCPTLDIFSQNSFCGIVNEMFTRRPMWRRSHKQPLKAKEIALWFCCITGFYLKKLLDITRVTVKWISITRVLKRHWHPKGLFWFVFLKNEWGGGGGMWEKQEFILFTSQARRLQTSLKSKIFHLDEICKILKAVCSHSVDKEFQCAYEVNDSHFASGLK